MTVILLLSSEKRWVSPRKIVSHSLLSGPSVVTTEAQASWCLMLSFQARGGILHPCGPHGHEQGPAQTSKDGAVAASAIWTVEPVPGLSVRGSSLCPTSLPEGMVCPFSTRGRGLCPLSTRGHGLTPLHQREWSVPPLHQRAWSAPSPPEGAACAHLSAKGHDLCPLSTRGHGLCLTFPSGAVACP